MRKVYTRRHLEEATHRSRQRLEQITMSLSTARAGKKPIAGIGDIAAHACMLRRRLTIPTRLKLVRRATRMAQTSQSLQRANLTLKMIQKKVASWKSRIRTNVSTTPLESGSSV